MQIFFLENIESTKEFDFLIDLSSILKTFAFVVYNVYFSYKDVFEDARKFQLTSILL